MHDNPELIDPVVKEILAEWIDKCLTEQNVELEALCRQWQALLGRCREIGIDAAFAESGRGADPDRTPDVQRLLSEWHRYLQNEDVSAQLRIDAARRLLAAIDPEREPFVFATTSGYLGLDLLSSARDEALGHLERALSGDTLLQQAPDLFANWAAAFGQQAVAWPRHPHTALQDRAIRHLERALAGANQQQAAVIEDCRHSLAALYAGRLEASPAAIPAGFTYDWPGDQVPPAAALRVNGTGRFSPLDPAPSIHELVTFLLQDKPDQYLFRGQTDDYPYLLPSTFRRGAVERVPRGGWVRVSNDVGQRFNDAAATGPSASAPASDAGPWQGDGQHRRAAIWARLRDNRRDRGSAHRRILRNARVPTV